MKFAVGGALAGQGQRPCGVRGGTPTKEKHNKQISIIKHGADNGGRDNRRKENVRRA